MMLNDSSLTTPYLLLDKVKFRRNIRRLYDHIDSLHCQIRPHLKTLRTVQSAPGYCVTGLHRPRCPHWLKPRRLLPQVTAISFMPWGLRRTSCRASRPVCV